MFLEILYTVQMIHTIYLGLNNTETIIRTFPPVIVIIVIVLVNIVVVAAVVVIACVTILFRVVCIRMEKVASQMLEAGVVGIHNAATVAFI